VDTWQGDPHAGIYGPEVLGELRSFHDERFGAFSTLLQSTFDEALDHIEDGSIDLLHIDGLHTYEAVRHDFESWLPKLSDRAVVIFHDTNVRQQDFGVWRLWAELRRQYPSFELVHGHGLGVLAVGGDAPAPVVALCSLTDPAAIAMIRTRFARLGEQWWIDTQHRILAKDLLRQKAADDAHARSLQTEIARRRTEAETLRAEVARQSAEAEALRAEVVRQSAKAEASRAALAQRDGQAEEAADHASRLGHALTQLQAELDNVRYSTAWRATWPARVVGQHLPSGLRRALRGSAELCWWAVTMKLPRKLKQRQRSFEASGQTEAASATPPAVSTEISPSATPAAVADDAQVNAPPKWAVANRVLLQPACTVSMVRAHCAPWAPLPVFSDRRAAPTLTVLVDAVESEHLLGSVGTALVVGVIAARHMGARLRLVTRQHAPDPALLRETLDAHRVSWDGATEFVHMSVGDTRPLPLGDRDRILTTSWCSTSAALGSVDAARVLYLLQEDERMSYPYGDSRLRCVETLREPNLPVLVNTRVLFDHFADGPEPLPRLRERGRWFEPAIPAFQRPQTVSTHKTKADFFFYAQPNNDRNLYWRGLEVINAAIRKGVLRSGEWNLHFVGCDLCDMELPDTLRPTLWTKLPWYRYSELVSQMDLGLCLMDMPHPSYPPLDLAASGAAVVTSTNGPKISLKNWSSNIIAAPPTVAALLDALEDGVHLARDRDQRFANCATDHIPRAWELQLNPVINQFLAPGT
jgi:hypothetical protein